MTHGWTVSSMLGCLALFPVQDTRASSIDTTQALAAFDQVQTLADGDAAKLWGVALEAPLLFVDKATRDVVTNSPDPGGRLVPGRGVYSGRLPDDVVIANTSTEWSGQRWTMLMWPLPTAEVDRAVLLVHESFHSVQPELGLSGAAEPCNHLATLDGRLWLRLETRALAAALTSQGEAEAARRAGTDALLFRAFRRMLFEDPAAVTDSENDLERVEGTAEYTGVRLGCPDGEMQRERTLTSLRGIGSRASLTRSFAYVTGPAWGLLLDAVDGDWRDELVAGASFSDLLAAAYEFELPGALEGAALERADLYGLEDLYTEELERELERERRLAVHRKRFVEGPVLILPSGERQMSYDPQTVDPLEGEGLVYGTLWASSAWGVADAPGGALLRSNGTIHLPAPSVMQGSHISGDGWTLELADGWSAQPAAREGDWTLTRD